MISQDSLDQIKSSVRLVDVVGETVDLKRRGVNSVGLCPFHSENSPSFHVHEDDNFYHCFGCGESGNVISWFMKSQGLSFPDAVDYIGQRFGIEIKRTGGKQKTTQKIDQRPFYELNKLTYKFFRRELERAPESVTDYLQQREIDENVQDFFGVGYIADEWRLLTDFLKKKSVPEDLIVQSGLAKRNSKGELYDTFRGRIMFPVWIDNQRIAGFGGRIIPGQDLKGSGDKGAPKYINSPESPVYHKSSIFYGLPQALSAIREAREVFVVEGYLDVIGLQRVGVANVVATCGTALTSEHVRRLKTLTGKVILLFDGDQAGRKAAARSFVTFINSGLDAGVLFLDEGEDPDTLAKQYGEQTHAYLKSTEIKSLFRCWLKNLVKEKGFFDISELGAAAKGKISELVIDQLKNIDNPVEQRQLLKDAGFLLNTPVDILKDLLNGKKVRLAERSPTQVEVQNSEVEGQEKIPEIHSLRAFERELLYAVMADKEKLVDPVLREPVLVAELHPAVISFIEQLAVVLSSETLNEEDKREKIREVLKEYGRDWLQHWKEAYQLKNDRTVSPEQIFQGCKEALKRERKSRALKAVEMQIEQCKDQAILAELVRQKIDLLKTKWPGQAV